MDAFKIVGKIFLDSTQAMDEMTKFNRKMDGLQSGISTFGKGVGTVAKGIGAVVGATALAAAGVFAATLKISESADNIQKLSDVSGISTTNIQKLQYVGKNLGVEIETVVSAQSKMIKTMDAAAGGSEKQANAFSKLGINVKDSAGNLRSSEQVMNEAFGALGKVGNETERDALAMQIFGKSARELNPMIKAGADELNRLSNEAVVMGAVMSPEKIAALDKFGDSIDSLKLAFQGITGSLAVAILPAMQGIVDFAMQMAVKLNEAVASGDWGGFVTTLSNGITTAITGLVDKLPVILQVGLDILTKLLQGLMSNMPQVMQAVISLISSLGDFIIQNLPMILQMGLEMMMTLVNGLINNVDKIMDGVIAIINAITTFFENNLAKIIELGFKLTFAIITGLIKALPKLIEAVINLGANIVQGIWTGMLNSFDWLMKKFTGFLVDILNAGKKILGIKSPSRIFAEQVGLPIAQGIGVGFMNGMSAVATQMGNVLTESIDKVFEKALKRIDWGTYSLAKQMEYAQGRAFTNNLEVYGSLSQFGYSQAEINKIASGNAKKEVNEKSGITPQVVQQTVNISAVMNSPVEVANEATKALQKLAFAY